MASDLREASPAAGGDVPAAACGGGRTAKPCPGALPWGCRGVREGSPRAPSTRQRRLPIGCPSAQPQRVAERSGFARWQLLQPWGWGFAGVQDAWRERGGCSGGPGSPCAPHLTRCMVGWGRAALCTRAALTPDS